MAPLQCQASDGQQCCSIEWFDQGWRCPYEWRPNDLNVSIGTTVEVTLATARLWTHCIGDPASEIFRKSDLQGLHYEVLGVHRTPQYTQVKVRCHDTQLEVWLNVWHRTGSSGVRHARILH